MLTAGLLGSNLPRMTFLGQIASRWWSAGVRRDITYAVSEIGSPAVVLRQGSAHRTARPAEAHHSTT